VRLGVPRQAITVQGFGESRPLVQTAEALVGFRGGEVESGARG